MYDKLGEMLNEALESGRIPQNEQNDQVDSHENIEESGHFSFKESEKSTENPNCEAKTTRHCKAEGRSKPTGLVIKLHKYTYNMHFPPEISKALSTLDIAYPFTTKDITTAYHKKLKEIHQQLPTYFKAIFRQPLQCEHCRSQRFYRHSVFI